MEHSKIYFFKGHFKKFQTSLIDFVYILRNRFNTANDDLCPIRRGNVFSNLVHESMFHVELIPKAALWINDTYSGTETG